MPRERTPEEDVPLLTKLKRLTGRGGDVELPNDGPKDKRLRTTADDISEGLTKVQSLMGLKKASERK